MNQHTKENRAITFSPVFKNSFLTPNSFENSFEDIDRLSEVLVESYNTNLIWVHQTIEEPWFKI